MSFLFVAEFIIYVVKNRFRISFEDTTEDRLFTNTILGFDVQKVDFIYARLIFLRRTYVLIKQLSSADK